MLNTFGSLFSGIGGLDRGLERAGLYCKWQVEINSYCLQVLRKHWPHVPKFHDVREIVSLPPVDLICGGFPCQPVSIAGKQRGQKDDRWLWPEFHRIVQLVRPRYVLVENVPGLLSANGGDAMSEVLGDLAASGYDAEWESVPAAAVGAPHLRYRVFLVAYPRSDGLFWAHQTQGEEAERSELDRPAGGFGRPGAGMAHAESTGTMSAEQPRQRHGTQQGGEAMAHANEGRSQRTQQSLRTRRPVTELRREKMAHTESPRSGSLPIQQRRPQQEGLDPDGGRPEMADASRSGSQGPRVFGAAPERGEWWRTEPSVGRVAHGVPSRVDRITALGNAVVPQMSEWIARQIIAFDEVTT